MNWILVTAVFFSMLAASPPAEAPIDKTATLKPPPPFEVSADSDLAFFHETNDYTHADLLSSGLHGGILSKKYLSRSKKQF